MNHQDFKQVVFTKGGNRPGGIGPGSYKGLSNEKKALLYDFEETPTVKRFGSENGKIVQAARLAKLREPLRKRVSRQNLGLSRNLAISRICKNARHDLILRF